MLSSINPSGQQFLDAMNNIQSRLNTAQQQISTGLKVNQASDAPDQLSPILQLHASIQANTDAQTRLGTAQADVNAGAAALSSSVDLLQQASVLASEGLGVGETAATRATMAQSVEGLMQQMVANSQTSVEGRYVFSGDQDQSALYQLDLTSPTGVDRLAVSPSTGLMQGADGSQFSISRSANDIFDHRNTDDTPASDNVFAALNGLYTALNNNDTAGIQASVSALDTAATYMNGQLAFYGQAQNRVSAGLTQAQSMNVALQADLSSRQDADSTQAITELTQAQTQMQAALAAQARMPQQSLFSVLPNGG
jgi:flagellar hook-associated protein 3 FlgL